MRIAETSRIELRAQFGHPVFVPNVIFLESQMSLEQSVEFRFWEAARCSLVAPVSTATLPGGRRISRLPSHSKTVEKGQRSSKE